MFNHWMENTPLTVGDKVTSKMYRERSIDMSGIIEEIAEMPDKYDYVCPCYFIRWDNGDVTYEYTEDIIAY